MISRVVLTILYFVLLPPFAWAARKAEGREALGGTPVKSQRPEAMKDQY